MHSLHIYFLYFVQFLKARMSYKWDFFGGIFASLLSAVSGVAFIFLLVDGKAVPDLQGWGREQVLFIYGYSLLATAMFGFVSVNLYRFGERYIIEGQFDRVLLRPLNSLFQVLFESFNLESLGSLSLGVALLVYTSGEMGLSFSILDLGWLVVSALCGAIILVSIFSIVASASFHFEDRLGLVPPLSNLLSFSRYPLPIFNKTLQIILSWIIPFAFVSFYPATHFFEANSREVLGYWTPMVALVSVVAAAGFWRLGVSKYASTGS